MSISAIPLLEEPMDPGTGPGAGDDLGVGRSQWRLIARRFMRYRPAMVALIILVAMFGLAIFAKQVAPYPLNPVLNAATLDNRNQPPSASHWFGTDSLGVDVLTQILFAARVSLTVGLSVALVSTLVGVAVGSVAGFLGGVVDAVLMRATDLFLIVPGIAILAMVQKGLTGKDLWVVGRVSSTVLMTVSLSLIVWMSIARVVRGLCLSIREKEYVEAAGASGASSLRIVTWHILPNVVVPIAVDATLAIGAAITLESTLSTSGSGCSPRPCRGARCSPGHGSRSAPLRRTLSTSRAWRCCSRCSA